VFLLTLKFKEELSLFFIGFKKALLSYDPVFESLS
jgi:hypothetical protein